VVRCESLAAFDGFSAKALADPAYLEIMAEGAPLYVDSSNVANYYQTVP
jgi:hypothetical protein